MSGLIRCLAIAAFGFGIFAVSMASADAGNRYRYNNNGGDFAAGVITGLVVGGIISQSRRPGGYYGRYYRKRGYYARPGYNPYPRARYYRKPPPRRYYAPRPRYYAPPPRYRVNLTRSHYGWCDAKYRSYRAYDNTFQPYHGPRKQCVSPYY